MKIMISPAEYAASIRYCYGTNGFVHAVLEAAKQYPHVPSSYWTEVLSEGKVLSEG